MIPSGVIFYGVKIMIAKDKKMHFWAGLAIAIVAGPFSFLLLRWLWAWPLLFLGVPALGFIIAAVIGALKEIIWDWLMRKGTPEFLDFLATCVGGSVGALIFRLLGLR